MIRVIPTNRQPITIVANISTISPQKIRIVARDATKPHSVYADRKRIVNGKDSLEIKMPKSPENTEIIIYNVNNPTQDNYKYDDNSFSVKFDHTALKTCPMFMSKEALSFIKFAQEFCDNAGILSGDNYYNGRIVPSVYSSDDGQFSIHYFDKIIDKKTGNFVGTPARIGHDSGIIEVSKSDFQKYSVPMRMVILLHEFSHKYMNPKINREVSYETGADINALMLYFALGYSEIEAHQAFLNVFRGANNEENFKRYKIINDFIDRYSKGEINNCYVETKSKIIK